MPEKGLNRVSLHGKSKTTLMFGRRNSLFEENALLAEYQGVRKKLDNAAAIVEPRWKFGIFPTKNTTLHYAKFGMTLDRWAWLRSRADKKLPHYKVFGSKLRAFLRLLMMRTGIEPSSDMSFCHRNSKLTRKHWRSRQGFEVNSTSLPLRNEKPRNFFVDQENLEFSLEGLLCVAHLLFIVRTFCPDAVLEWKNFLIEIKEWDSVRPIMFSFQSYFLIGVATVV